MQGMFVRVNAEQTALQMRKDLRHWRIAADLASRCAPQEVASLQQQHAESLEMQGDVSAAHATFQVLVQLLHSAHLCGHVRPTVRVGQKLPATIFNRAACRKL